MINQISSFQTYSKNDLKLKLPFGCIVSGPSSSGKSTFVRSLIINSKEVIDPTPKSILYCYGEYNSLVSDLQREGVTVYSGVPSEDIIKKQEKPSLIILDDLLYSIDEKYLSELFTKKSHHLNFGIVFVTQNLFEKKLRVARQNSMYLVLTRAPNSALSQHVKTSYLFIDLHPSSDPSLRLRTNIFDFASEKKDSDNFETTIFLPKTNN
uniref:AAA domain-containing protein n=1 Tax=Meloidogyne hapla TaxID=6305 RepID=A0A1I8BRN3_MELHA